eukprot:NODE_1137_length_1682_cov_23.423760_g1007_i0.p1 GENE.NODE_1137_length_1682_cov_23.423760_g1007_i0~~NODE_1137_length_1682_cov_23.423760_g1007_i0.p1  ORF type:complete len:454 (+),score=49.79 NODE_1137_length_1682_cov_23.423760_g1007_i0:168-1529(+)
MASDLSSDLAMIPCVEVGEGKDATLAAASPDRRNGTSSTRRGGGRNRQPRVSLVVSGRAEEVVEGDGVDDEEQPLLNPDAPPACAVFRGHGVQYSFEKVYEGSDLTEIPGMLPWSSDVPIAAVVWSGSDDSTSLRALSTELIRSALSVFQGGDAETESSTMRLAAMRLEGDSVFDASTGATVLIRRNKRIELTDLTWTHISADGEVLGKLQSHLRAADEFVVLLECGQVRMKRRAAVVQLNHSRSRPTRNQKTLGNVLAALGNHAAYVPYRQAPLTRILEDYIGNMFVYLTVGATRRHRADAIALMHTACRIGVALPSTPGTPSRISELSKPRLRTRSPDAASSPQAVTSPARLRTGRSPSKTKVPATVLFDTPPRLSEISQARTPEEHTLLLRGALIQREEMECRRRLAAEECDHRKWVTDLVRGSAIRLNASRRGSYRATLRIAGHFEAES